MEVILNGSPVIGTITHRKWSEKYVFVKYADGKKIAASWNLNMGAKYGMYRFSETSRPHSDVTDELGTLTAWSNWYSEFNGQANYIYGPRLYLWK